MSPTDPSLRSRPTPPPGILEYSVFLFLVAIVAVIVLLTQGGAIHNVFTNIATAWNKG